MHLPKNNEEPSVKVENPYDKTFESEKNGDKVKVSDGQEEKKAESVLDKNANHENNLKCEVCAKTFSTKSTLKQHKVVHSSGKPLLRFPKHACQVCREDFPTKEKLEIHILIHGDEWPNKCEVCGKCFIKIRFLDNHMKVHTDIKTFKCEKCSRYFYSKQALDSHKLDCEEKAFKCNICGKWFSHKRNLYVHKKNHCEKDHIKKDVQNSPELKSGEKPFKCKECGKYFSLKHYLQAHEKRHREEDTIRKNLDMSKDSENNDQKSFPMRDPIIQVYDHNPQDSHSPVKLSGKYEDPLNIPMPTLQEKNPKHFKCGVCMQSFTTATHLKRHSLTHSGETPFKCTICQSLFRIQKTLTHHLLLMHCHRDDLQCRFCNKDFTNLKYLKNHMKLHIEVKDQLVDHVKETEFQCQHCGKYLSTKCNLERHIKRKHSNMPLNEKTTDSLKSNTPLNKYIVLHTECKDTNKVSSKGSENNDDLEKDQKSPTNTNDHSLQLCDKNSFLQSPHSPLKFPLKKEDRFNYQDPTILDCSMYNDTRLPEHHYDEATSYPIILKSFAISEQEFNLKSPGSSEKEINLKSPPGSSEQEFCEEFSQVTHRNPPQPAISRVRVYFEDGVYCEVSSAELTNLNMVIDQLNASPRVELSSVGPILRGRSLVLVNVHVVFQDCDSRDVLGTRNANI